MQGQAWPAADALSGVFSSFKLILPFHIPPQAGQRVGGPERIRKQPLRQGAEPQMALIGLPADDLKLQLCGLGEKKGEVRPPGLIPEAESRRLVPFQQFSRKGQGQPFLQLLQAVETGSNFQALHRLPPKLSRSRRYSSGRKYSHFPASRPKALRPSNQPSFIFLAASPGWYAKAVPSRCAGLM